MREQEKEREEETESEGERVGGMKDNSLCARLHQNSMHFLLVLHQTRPLCSSGNSKVGQCISKVLCVFAIMQLLQEGILYTTIYLIYLEI